MAFNKSPDVYRCIVDYVTNEKFCGNFTPTESGYVEPLPPYPELVMESNPYIYYHFDEKFSNTLFDESGNANHGSCSNVTFRSTTSLVASTCTSMYMFHSNHTLTDLPAPVDPITTVEFWCKIAPHETLTTNLYERRQTPSSGDISRIQFKDDYFTLWSIVGGDFNQINISDNPYPVHPNSLRREDLHHFVMQVEGGRTYFYIDGVKQSTSVAGDMINISFTNLRFTIGSPSSNGEFYADEFAMYQTVLPEDVILDHYNAGRPEGNAISTFLDLMEPTILFDFRGRKNYINHGVLGSEHDGLVFSEDTGLPPDLRLEDKRHVMKGDRIAKGTINSHQIFGDGTEYSIMTYFRKTDNAYDGICGMRAGYPNISVFVNNIWNGGSGGDQINIEHFLSDGSNAGTLSFTPYSTSEWYLLVYVRNGADHYLYVNGELVDSGTVSNPALAVKDQTARWQIMQDGSFREENGLTSFNAAFDYAIDEQTILDLNSIVHELCEGTNTILAGNPSLSVTRGLNLVRTVDFDQSIDVVRGEDLIFNHTGIMQTDLAGIGNDDRIFNNPYVDTLSIIGNSPGADYVNEIKNLFNEEVYFYLDETSGTTSINQDGNNGLSVVPVSGRASYAEQALMDDPVLMYLFNDTTPTRIENRTRVDRFGSVVSAPNFPIAPLYSTDIGSIEFDGVDDYIQVTKDTALDIAGDLTLEIRFKLNVVDNGFSNQRLFSHSPDVDDDTNDNKNYLYSLYVNSDGQLATFWEYTGGANETINSGIFLSAGVNYTVVMTRDATLKELKFYIDGTLQSTQPYSNNPTGGETCQVAIGNSGSDANRPLNGVVSFAAIYDKVLSPTRVSEHWLCDDEATVTAQGDIITSKSMIRNPDSVARVFPINTPVEFDDDTDDLDNKTFTAWVRFGDFTGDQIIFASGGNANGWAVGLSGGNLILGIRSNLSLQSVSYPTTNLNLYEPYFIVAQVSTSGNIMRLEVNNTIVAEDLVTDVGTHNGTNTDSIGGTVKANLDNPITGVDGEDRFVGVISHVNVKNRILTTDEKTRLYNVGKYGTILR